MTPQQPQRPGQPVVGFNHNVTYKGKTFHVQTEDSGTAHGHIITHTFLGGNILSSVKSSYAEVLATLQPGEVFAAVRKLMEDQHKAMMKALLGGQHDAEIARRTGQSHYEPGVLAGGERAPGLLVGGDKLPGPKAPATVARPAPIQPPPTRAAAPSQPPPTRAAPAPLASALPKAPPRPMPSSVPAVRPPGPVPQVTTALFGDGLLSDKSLDEVILSYLAADLDSKR